MFKKHKRIFKILGIILLAFILFIGLLLFVQYRNANLNDISLIVKNFQYTKTLSDDCMIVEQNRRGHYIYYRIDDGANTIVLRVDDDWVANHKSMLVWSNYPVNETTDAIIQNEPVTWDLNLTQNHIGKLIFYKDILMNPIAETDVSNLFTVEEE